MLYQFSAMHYHSTSLLHETPVHVPHQARAHVHTLHILCLPPTKRHVCCSSYLVCVTWREVQRPGTAKEGRNTTEESTATVNPNDHQLAPLIDHTLDSTTKSTHESRRSRTPTSTSTLHACEMHYTTQNQQGHQQSPLSQHNPVRFAGRPCRATTQTPPSTTKTHTQPSRKAHHHEELMVNEGYTASLPGGPGRGEERGGGYGRIASRASEWRGRANRGQNEGVGTVGAGASLARRGGHTL